VRLHFAALACAAAIIASSCAQPDPPPPPAAAPTAAPAPAPAPALVWPAFSPEVRQALAAELQPVTLKNCTLRRYGSANDGGYLMCENLTDTAAAAYSYGIDTEDNWGCDISKERGLVVHQYDCFTPHRPTCDGGQFAFHNECVGPRRESVDGHPFDTLPSQIARNGDAGKPLLMKMDIEGAEWESLRATPDEVLDTFVQLPMELHLRAADEAQILETVKRLKRQFYLVNVHFNNWSCNRAFAPLPAQAFQVLWVNRRVGVINPDAPVPAPSSPLNAPDNPAKPECGAK
jgi:hypothetical protein